MFILQKLIELVQQKGMQASRYVLVTLMNVAINQGTLTLADRQWGWSPFTASVLAGLVGMVPAYFASRYWVWQIRGSHSLRAELIPFFAIGILGMVVAAGFAEAGERIHDAPWAVNIGNFTGYFVVWLMKFFLLDKLFTPSEKPPVTATS